MLSNGSRDFVKELVLEYGIEQSGRIFLRRGFLWIGIRRMPSGRNTEAAIMGPFSAVPFDFGLYQELLDTLKQRKAST